jgi:hypothetical protein
MDTPSRFANKNLLVVATGPIKKAPIFRRLKSLGLTLIVLHPEKNWATPYADHWIFSDFQPEQALPALQRFEAQNPMRFCVS